MRVHPESPTEFVITTEDEKEAHQLKDIKVLHYKGREYKVRNSYIGFEDNDFFAIFVTVNPSVKV